MRETASRTRAAVDMAVYFAFLKGSNFVFRAARSYAVAPMNGGASPVSFFSGRGRVSVQPGARPTAGQMDAALNRAMETGGVVRIVPGAYDGAITRTFWSGGTPARAAAESWAKANGGTTLEMSRAGQNVEQLTQSMPWKQARPLWAQTSQSFSRAASGEVHVFHNAHGVAIDSVWATIEYPALMNNANVTGIVGHVVMPNGTVVAVP